MRVRVLKACNIKGPFHAGEVCDVDYPTYAAHHALGNCEALDDPIREVTRLLSDASREPERLAYEARRAERDQEFEINKGIIIRQHEDERRRRRS